MESPRKKVKVEVEEELRDCWRCDLHATKQELRKHDVQCMLKYNEENPEQYRLDQPAPKGLLTIVTAFTKKYQLSIYALNDFFGILHDYQLSNVLLSPVHSFPYSYTTDKEGIYRSIQSRLYQKRSNF